MMNYLSMSGTMRFRGVLYLLPVSAAVEIDVFRALKIMRMLFSYSSWNLHLDLEFLLLGKLLYYFHELCMSLKYSCLTELSHKTALFEEFYNRLQSILTYPKTSLCSRHASSFQIKLN